MQPPSDPPASRQRWVSFAEAMKILSLSESTLRRRIRSGRVVGEPMPRTPDSPSDGRIQYRVLITDPPSDPPASTAPFEFEQPPPIHQETPPPVTGIPLDELLAAHDQVGEMHREVVEGLLRIAALERENGTLQATADHQSARAERAEAALLARQRANARPWWRRMFR